MKELAVLEKKTKGYGYDSLCLRYKIAREAQMRAEIHDVYEGDRYRAQRAANRDMGRFCQILDELIGEHD